jgi:hypothetical protein
LLLVMSDEAVPFLWLLLLMLTLALLLMSWLLFLVHQLLWWFLLFPGFAAGPSRVAAPLGPYTTGTWAPCTVRQKHGFVEFAMW